MLYYPISWSLPATVYLSRDEDGIGWSKFFLEFALECSYVYYASPPSPILRDRLHLVRDTAAEKQFDILQYRRHWSTLIHRSKKIELNRKTNCYQRRINLRSNHWKVFCKNGVLRNFLKFTEKHLCQSFFFSKLLLSFALNSLNIRGIFRIQPKISDGIFLWK